MAQQESSELVKSIEEFRNYLKTDEGKYHINYLKEKEPQETRELLTKLKTLSKDSPDFVEYVLYGLLPNSSTKYAKRVSVSPAFLNIRKFFGRFNYSENDWRELATLIYNLVAKLSKIQPISMISSGSLSQTS